MLVVYRIMSGGKLGYVTPAANPCNTRIVKRNHKFAFDATGTINVRTAQNNCVHPRIILLPNFSDNVPPRI